MNSKSWVNPDGKNPIWQPPTSNSLQFLFSVFLAVYTIIKDHIFSYPFFTRKVQNKKILIFNPKSWVNPSQNIQHGHPHIKLFTTAPFGIFSSLNSRHGQTP